LVKDRNKILLDIKQTLIVYILVRSKLLSNMKPFLEA